MAVNIDTVYQRVLAIANKEQRGYLTPQEFNLYANQAQMDIFEQYFYDLNAFSRLPGNDYTYSDQVDILQEKIDIFERFRQAVTYVSGNDFTLPNHYRIGELFYKYKGGYIEIEKINQNEVHHIENSPLTAPSPTRPVYVRSQGGASNGETAIKVFPVSIVDNVYCNYIANPVSVNWAYVINATNGKALYNSNLARHFELHDSEETELVIKILELAGITLKDPQVYQVAATEEAQNVQQENK